MYGWVAEREGYIWLGLILFVTLWTVPWIVGPLVLFCSFAYTTWYATRLGKGTR